MGGVIQPKLQRVDHVYVLIEILPDGRELVCPLNDHEVWPSRDAFEDMKETIQTVANKKKHRFRLLRFDGRSEVETVKPELPRKEGQ